MLADQPWLCRRAALMLMNVTASHKLSPAL